MVQAADGVEVGYVAEADPNDSTPNYHDEVTRTVLAVSDANNLLDALGAKLGWLGQSLSSDGYDDDARLHMREVVEVCVQLTKLLGGALCTCRPPANTTRNPSFIEIRQLVDDVIYEVAVSAESIPVTIQRDIPLEALARVDAELTAPAVHAVIEHAMRLTLPGGLVRVSAKICGGHVVFAVTTDEPGSRVPQSRVQRKCGPSTLADPPAASLSERLGMVAAQLREQGGYLDVEEHPNGGTTLFVVVPAIPVATSEPESESTEPSRVAHTGTPLASDDCSLRQSETGPGQKRSEKMIVNSDRFGAIEVDIGDIVKFPTGIIGFPNDNQFVLVRKPDSQIIGWLQSVQTSYLTLPVVSAHALAARFPDVPVGPYAERMGLGNDPEELAILVVLSAPPHQPATVNLMAPIIVNAATRIGAQVLLEGSRFTTRELFVIPPQSEEPATTESVAAETTQSATSAAE